MDKRLGIGPQHKRDVLFTARMRFHQSWYRANMLKLPYGTGPQKHHTNYFGSMLTEEDGNRGQNFLSSEIFLLAKKRAEEGTGTVDVFRLFCNLLSSMPMCFNLFGPLKNDLQLASKLLKTLLPGQIGEVTEIVFEYSPSPRKDYLNDRTAFDIFVEFETPERLPAFIGIEVKLTEPFSPTKHENPRYDFWTERPDSPWKPECRGQLVEKNVNQLWRNHLLVQSLLGVQKDKYSKGFFMTIYHQDDIECVKSLDKYLSLLEEGHNASHFSLEDIRNLWQPLIQGTENEIWFDAFVVRYLDMSASKAEFVDFR